MDVSYSATNLTSAIAQSNGLATVIKQQTFGGGTAIKTTFMLLCHVGLCLAIPGTYAYKDDPLIVMEEYVSIETGVMPDILMSDLLNDEELVEIINNHQSGTE